MTYDSGSCPGAAAALSHIFQILMLILPKGLRRSELVITVLARLARDEVLLDLENLMIFSLMLSP